MKIQLLVSGLLATLVAPLGLLGSDTAPAGAPSLLAGPIVGLVWEPSSRILRPILGIPGASVMGEPVALDFEIATAAISPREDYALALSTAGELKIVQIRDRVAESSVVQGFDDPQANIIMSPSGTAALIYTAGGGHILTGLPGKPAVRGAVSFNALAGELGALAVSDDGAALLAAMKGGESDSLFVLGVASEPTPLPIVGRASLVTFQNGTHNALVADRENDQIAEIKNVNGKPEYRGLAGPGEGIADPVGLAVSRDNRRLFVASARSSSILALDLSDGAIRSINCNCKLERLEQLGANSLFRVNEGKDTTLWIFDGSGADLRLVFVPPSGKLQPQETSADKGSPQ